MEKCILIDELIHYMDSYEKGFFNVEEYICDFNREGDNNWIELPKINEEEIVCAFANKKLNLDKDLRYQKVVKSDEPIYDNHLLIEYDDILYDEWDDFREDYLRKKVIRWCKKNEINYTLKSLSENCISGSANVYLLLEESSISDVKINNGVMNIYSYITVENCENINRIFKIRAYLNENKKKGNKNVKKNYVNGRDKDKNEKFFLAKKEKKVFDIIFECKYDEGINITNEWKLPKIVLEIVFYAQNP